MDLLRVVCPCIVKEKDDTPEALKLSVFEGEDYDYRHTPRALKPTGKEDYALKKMHTPQDLKPVKTPKGYMTTPKALLPQKQKKYLETPKALKPKRLKNPLATPTALKPFQDEASRRRHLGGGKTPRKDLQISMFESAYDSDDDFEDESTISPREPEF